MNYLCAGYSELGYRRKTNEDLLYYEEISDNCVVLAVADACGSQPGIFQPAQLVINKIKTVFHDAAETSDILISEHKGFLLKTALHQANELLNLFHFIDKERYPGCGCSVTCCILEPELNRLSFAHAGNTRLYILRANGKSDVKPIQLTTDHTAAKQKVENGQITATDYYTHPDRFKLTNGLGVYQSPELQVICNLPVKLQDILMLSSDGIHYAIREEHIVSIILQSENCPEAAKNLVAASKSEKYPDNASALIVFMG